MAQFTRIDDAAEFNDAAVASALDDAPMVHGDCRVDQIATKGPKPCKDAIFVRASKPGVADDVGHQDRRELAGLAHCAPRKRHSTTIFQIGASKNPAPNFRARPVLKPTTER